MTEQKTKAVFAAVPLVFLQAGYARWIIAVYGALASFQGLACECFPSLAQIALRAGVNQSNVSRAVSILKKSGWIQCQRRRRASSLYRVLPQEGLWANLSIAVLQAKLSRRDLLVYACLAIYQGAKPNSYPSRQEIAVRLQVKSLSSVSKSISKLKQEGWLTSSQRGAKSNLYSVLSQSDWQSGGVNRSDPRPVSISEQDKENLQFRSEQDKNGLQFRSEQDKNDLQFRSEQEYSSSLTNSCLNKTSYKTSFSIGSKTNSTLGSSSSDLTKIRASKSSSLTKTRAVKAPNSSQPAKIRPPNSSDLSRLKPQASLGCKNINRSVCMNGNEYKPIEAEKQSIERSIYYALKRSSTRDVLFDTVLPHLYGQMKSKIEAAIVKEEQGRLYLRRSVLGESLEKKLRHYMGSALVFEKGLRSPESGQSILEYLEGALFKGCHPYAKEGILGAVIREEYGLLYVDESKILPHHAQLLESSLGKHVVFCETGIEQTQETAVA